MTATRRAILTASAAAAISGCGGSGLAAPPASPRDALGDLDGIGAAAAIKRRDITPREAVEAAIARAAKVNPQINTIATDAFEFARARSAEPLRGPFAGVPTMIKDLIDMAGVKAMYGSRAFRNNIARIDNDYVTAVKAMGAIPIAKSAVPEFGLTCTTEPLLTGPTRNPWNTDHIAGGSSGGSAAAVAAGVVPIAHASDGGGSARIPASICGIFGFKVSRGRLINAPDGSPIVLGVEGCVSRSVRDTAAWLAATERPHNGLTAMGHVTTPSERRLRIGLVTTTATGAPLDAAVRAAVEDAGRLCESLGHRVSPKVISIDFRQFEAAFLTYWAMGAGQLALNVQRNANGAPLEDLLEPLTLQLALHAAISPPGAMENAVAHLQQLPPAYAQQFSDVDVLLTPTLASPPLRIGEIAPTLPVDQGLAKIKDYILYTPLANVTGAPAMSVPLAWSETDLPLGAHFMAKPGEEKMLLALAYELERARPWAARKPPIWAG
ncbi:MAG: amidase [Caulobacterales bacterium]